MANEEHLRILKEGKMEPWNKWRAENRDILPDLADAALRGAYLRRANLIGARLFGADLTGANLSEARLFGADLRRANLKGANLNGATLIRATLNGADLSGTDLSGANFNEVNLTGADLTNAYFDDTIIADTDVSEALNIESVIHVGPSTIGIDTLYRSAGKIPEAFLRGAGVPDDLIAYIPALFSSSQSIQFYSCFISYSTKDEEFTQRLFSALRDRHLRVWFAPEEMKAGKKIHEQIDEAIRLHDKLLLVLSDSSIVSEWVMTEIRKARKRELREKRQVLFPIRLTDMTTLKEWECFDADSGKDLGTEVREYFIPDFSNWKNHDSFQESFEKLLKALKNSEKAK